MKKIILFFIRIYQKIFSFDHGIMKIWKPYGQCRFIPTCSEYTYQAIERYGTIKGLYLGVKRISKCHPWNKGGVDVLK